MQRTIRQQMTIMLLLAASLSLVLASGASSAAQAATCAVTSLSDTGNGSGGNLGFGDLRYCINRANASPGADVIEFAVSGTVTLSSVLPNITDSVTITGRGQTTTVVRAQATPTFERRVFQIVAGAGVTVNINNLTVTGGFLQTTSGGGIGVGNGATVNLTNVTVENNQARFGGGVAAVDSTLNIVNSRIVGNRASVTDSSNNGGGGIYVLRTTFTMTGSTVDGNRAESPGDISLGGGLGIQDGNATRIENSTISNNITIGFGGGIANDNTWLRMANVTVSGNYAYFGGSGLYFSSGTSTLRNCTIAHNTVNNQTPVNAKSGIVVNANTILRIANTIAAANSTSMVGEGYSIINFGTVTRLGVNIVRFGVVNEGRGTTNGGGTVLDVEPNLQSLADNGGKVRTHRLPFGSPAINAGANSEALDTNDPPQPLTTDARGAGFARIVGNTVDIGAFEVSPVEYLLPSSISIIGESVSPANNAPDPGETMTVGVALRNYGTTNSGDNVTVTLLPSGITNPSGAENYGTLLVNGAPVTRSFRFTVPASAAFGSQITLTFQVQDGANSSTFTQTYTIATPALVNGQVTITGENFSPANNAPDPGETVTVSVPLRNNGNGNSGANVTVTLQPTGGITEPSQAQNYGTITPNGTAARTFTFKVPSSAVCDSRITLTFQAQDGATSFTFAQSFALGALALTAAENFDQVTAPALPAGWSSTRSEAGTGWTTATTTPASQPNAAFAGNPDSMGLSELESPAWNVTSANARLDFKINYNTEESFDGAVLEIKIGAGAYQDILAAGGSFTAGGYSGQLYYGSGYDNPLGLGRSVWMGNSNGYVSSSVNLPAAANGQTVRFRWLMGSDEGTGATGVQLDDVRLFGASNCSLPSCAAITLSPAALPAGQAGQNYSQTITAAGGNGSYTFTLSAGNLPGNLTLATSGLLAGAPTGFGTFNFTVRATDGNGCTGTRPYTLTINPPCPTIIVNPATLPGGTIGTNYSQSLMQSGGSGAITWTVSQGALPGGLMLNPTSGSLSGMPTTANTFNFTITATDANGCTGQRAYTVTVTAGGSTTSGLQYYALPAPVRLLDTRPGASPIACSQPNAPIAGGSTRLQPARNFCGIPANAQAITGHITTVQSGGGYLTLYSSGAARPTIASTNYSPNEIVNNVFTVGLGNADGAFDIYALNTTEVVVDVTGYYAPPGPGGLYFHPLPAPVRLLETRAGQPVGCVKPGAPLAGGADSLQTATTACTGIPAAARALVGNATTVSPQGPGYLTIFPAEAARPLIASSNYDTNQIVNGPFTTGLSAAGQFKVFTLATTDLVIDVLGYYSAEANDANGAGLLYTPLAQPVRWLETRAGQAVGCFKPGQPLAGNQSYVQPARGSCAGQTIPAAALAVVGNATVVSPAADGYLTLWPASAARPTVATVNYKGGEIVNRHFIVGLGTADGAFKMFSLATTDLVIDLAGYFAP